MNVLHIIGNLTRDPDSKTLPSGVNVCSFTVAVNGKRKEDETQFIRVTTWRQLAENCQRFLGKGRKVAVYGAVSLRTYKGKDGEIKASLELNADNVEFLSPRSDADDTGLTYTPPTDKQSGMMIVEDDSELPF